MDDIPFWKNKTLTEMSTPEWERLCDGCGLCCLNKIGEWDSGDIYFTSIRCKLMDGEAIAAPTIRTAGILCLIACN